MNSNSQPTGSESKEPVPQDNDCVGAGFKPARARTALSPDTGSYVCFSNSVTPRSRKAIRTRDPAEITASNW